MDIFHNKSNLCTKMPYLHIRAVYNILGHQFSNNHKSSREKNKT